MSLLDLHNHIVGRSNDSDLRIEDLVGICRARGIGGACITDHDRWLSVDEAEALSTEHDFLLLNGVEVGIGDFGHFLCFGHLNLFDAEVPVAALIEALQSLVGSCRQLERDQLTRNEVSSLLENSPLARLVRGHSGILDLITAVHDQGGAVIWAHPLSYTPLRRLYDDFFHARPDASQENFLVHIEEHHQEVFQVLQVVDGLEGLNGCRDERGMVNRQVIELARTMGKPVTGGSDSHSTGGVGTCTTRFDDDPRNTEELVSAIRSGRFNAFPVI
jgi:predicted metal-dependent phosphoesterase TrpH